MNLAALERLAAEQADLAAIPALSPEERGQLLADYQVPVQQTTEKIEQALEQLAAQTIPDYRALYALKALARKRSAAQKSYERIARAIAKAEKAKQGSLPAGLTTMGRRKHT